MIHTESTCTRCGQTKPISEFYYASNKTNGASSHCKQCQRERSSGVTWEGYDTPEAVREWLRRPVCVSCDD